MRSLQKVNPISRLSAILLCGLGVLLPLHGLISVVLPSPLRWWKEVFLLLLGLTSLTRVFGAKTLPRDIKKSFLALAKLIAWGAALVLLSDRPGTAALALRPLLLGPLVAATLLPLNTQTNRTSFFKGLLCGLGASVLFGLFIYFESGKEFLSTLYSTTISSWVPGQTLPLFHEIRGIPRLQGGASGPVALGHLLMVGLFGLTQIPLSRWNKNILQGLLFGAILLTASRGAVIGGLLVLGWPLLMPHWQRFSSVQKKTLCAVSVLFISAGIATTLSRPGSLDHIQKPIAGLAAWTESPIVGQLGHIGPAARAWNLEHLNTDVALITENVWIDIAVQMGLVGLLCIVFFLWLVFRRTLKKHAGYALAFLLTTQFATLFDMAPVAIAMWAALAFATHFPHSAEDELDPH